MEYRNIAGRIYELSMTRGRTFLVSVPQEVDAEEYKFFKEWLALIEAEIVNTPHPPRAEEAK